MKLNFLDKFEFFSGIPDSQLKPICNYIFEKYGISNKHIIAANEGNCAALASGYYIATKKIPIVYLQNSGIGNLINPIASLMNDKVYGIPCIFLIGWRGEPDLHDEPQHIFQGEITLKLLHDMDIKTYIIDSKTEECDIISQLDIWCPLLKSGKQVALVFKKDSFKQMNEIALCNENVMNREDVIEHIISVSQKDPVITTTGKTSRELYEIRDRNNQDHKYDFLTVGSMGHSSSIALGIALNMPKQKIWCIDGDGAVIMHMGALAIIGSNKPNNLIHILINNYSHESVGGLPTVADSIDFVKITQACGYEYAISVDNYLSLDSELLKAKESSKLTFIEVKCAISSRANLGRPKTSTKENLTDFMNYLEDLS